MPTPPFSVHRPTEQTVPVVVEVPHAGLWVDTSAMATLVAPVRSLGRDADLFVDELCADAPELGAPLLVSNTSRMVCDLNRSPNAYDGRAVLGANGPQAPHGLIWHRTTEGASTLDEPLSAGEFERRRATIYQAYHDTLDRLLEETRSAFGYAILLCAHSMPSPRRDGTPSPTFFPDVVPGSRGGTTACRAIVDCPGRIAAQFGWRTQHDNPYPGGYTTFRHGHPPQGTHALQIELNRQLYMNETRLERLPRGFEQCRSFFRQLVLGLGSLPASALAPEPFSNPL